MKSLVAIGLGILMSASGYSQVMFTGIVRSAGKKKEALPGAKISVKGNNLQYENVLSTDANGLFFIKFSSSSVNQPCVIVISRNGYKTREISDVVATTLQPRVYDLDIAPATPGRSTAATRDAKITTTERKPVTNSVPAGQINNSNIEFNVQDAGVFGFKIHVDFDIDYLKNGDGLIAIDFYDLDGNPLKDKDNSLNYDDGKVGKQESFKPDYLHANYTDFDLFFPYYEFESIHGKHHSKYKVFLYRLNKKTNEYEYIAESYFYELEYEDT